MDEVWKNETNHWKGLVCDYPVILQRQRTMGYWMGYVLIEEKNHPWYGADVADLDYVDVHGKVAYTDYNPFVDDKSGDWWVGFYCGHAFDLVPYFWETEGREYPRLFKHDVYRDYAFAKAEVTKLAEAAREAQERFNPA